MKNIRSIGCAIAVVITFLLIQIRYNSSPYSSIFSGLIGEFGKPFLPQFAIPAIFLITVSALHKKWLSIVGTIVMVLLLFWFIHIFSGVLDFSLLSAIPFFIACILAIWYFATNYKTLKYNRR